MTDLTWGLLIATKDRLAPLKICVELALKQTCPPVEVVVADSSADWAKHHAEIKTIVDAYPEIRLEYMQGAAPSLTVQRNQVIDAAIADIGFMIDDDSFMHATCAEEIMAIYQADTIGAIAGVQASETGLNPAKGPVGERKNEINKPWLGQASGFMRWFLQTVLLMSKVSVFVPYDKTFPNHPLPDALNRLDLVAVALFGGFRMTFRMDVARREKFDPTLRYYCPGEDLDGSYRISRHGALVTANRALLHHYVSAAGRLNRLQVAHLWSFNQAVLLRRHAKDQSWARRAFQTKMLHRISTDVVKDSMMRRFSYPQTRGSFRAWRDGRRVFVMDADRLLDWYPQEQERIVKA